MDKLTYKAWVKAQCLKQSAKDKLRTFFCDEQGDGGTGGIIVGVVLIVVAIGLAVIFRDQIGAWIKKLFGTANEGVDNINSGFDYTVSE